MSLSKTTTRQVTEALQSLCFSEIQNLDTYDLKGRSIMPVWYAFPNCNCLYTCSRLEAICVWLKATHYYFQPSSSEEHQALFRLSEHNSFYTNGFINYHLEEHMLQTLLLGLCYIFHLFLILDFCEQIIHESGSNAWSIYFSCFWGL